MSRARSGRSKIRVGPSQWFRSLEQEVLESSEWRVGDRARVLDLDYPSFWPHSEQLPFFPTVTVGREYDVMGFEILLPLSQTNSSREPVLLVKLLDDDAEITSYHERRLQRIPGA